MLGHRGYTMVELVMVVVLVGLLGSVTLPVLADLDWWSGYFCSIRKNKLQQSAELYRVEKGTAVQSLEQLVPEFVQHIPHCSTGSDYYWDEGAGKVRCSLHKGE